MKELLEKFEDYLLNNLPKIDTFHPHFENAMQDMLKAGGKRFRPMLLLSVVNSKKPLLVTHEQAKFIRNYRWKKMKEKLF